MVAARERRLCLKSGPVMLSAGGPLRGLATGGENRGPERRRSVRLLCQPLLPRYVACGGVNPPGPMEGEGRVGVRSAQQTIADGVGAIAPPTHRRRRFEHHENES